MKAVGTYRSQPIEAVNSLVEEVVDQPNAEGRDILVRVEAVSVNPVDTKMRGHRKEDNGEFAILGYDASGVVESVGSDVTMFSPGDKVYYAGDFTRQGSNAPYQLVDERIVAKKPNTLTHEESAALPLTTLTAWEAMYERLGIHEDKDAGKAILIIGGAGGVGSVAIPLAKQTGLTVIATASREETNDWCIQRGADHIINHKHPLQPQLEELGFSDVPYIFCLSDTAEHWDNLVNCIAPEGAICSVVGVEQPLNLTDLMAKSATFAWEFMFTRPAFQTETMSRQHEILKKAAQFVDEGKLTTSMTENWAPLDAETLKQAHAKLEGGGMIGKLVISQKT
ncbi:zinc-binding alcohol dehydrogenase family protein [Salsuginibacillus halophilus]|uniref:Zinc-type alcohol dehydrogenase-like protein n=1 Tax=Salsuginibacillus halophilus TaxID=517424 RepID=A0A2P8HKV5_9BACI|nr:zinc-binding alcohol dehydrogenase family protein [Salsuginibacillus halophilus]PSL46854.1 zinc-binding alcohol dehydrogenase family protein [Salsuginibacillus halophilus]